MANFWVLVVDDEEGIRELVSDFIKKQIPEAKIVQAADGVEASGKISRQEFNLMITDVKMPKKDGLQLLRELEGMSPSARPREIMVMTAHGSFEGIPTGLGKIHFLGKPINFDYFKMQIARWTGQAPAGAPAKEQPKAKIDAAFIAPFVDATLMVVKTTAGIDAEKERIFIRPSDHPSGDISAVVAMNSDRYLGSMAVSFDESCFLAIVEGMLGEKFTQITPEIQDAAGELCNQIFGQAKKVLNAQGHTIQPAIPSVVVGPRHALKHTAMGPCISVRFNSAHGGFTVEAVMQGR